MSNLTKSILIVLLFNHLLMGCNSNNRVFRKGDCGCDEKGCGAPNTPGHGYYYYVQESIVETLEDQLKMLQEQKNKWMKKIKEN